MSLASEKEFLGELHLTRVGFCCSFSCRINPPGVVLLDEGLRCPAASVLLASECRGGELEPGRCRDLKADQGA